jgi:hypothetical protein
VYTRDFLLKRLPRAYFSTRGPLPVPRTRHILLLNISLYLHHCPELYA